ncbi:hypothetical protein QFC22_006011 [Naganishia vaughanmartiniae]|uniref:Uncharacterized protein n=1 Tax=Naganishia vaughanmartiniae TaxID=1424756 RepID=A0ACC2WQ45_9TREE|nr:hypothetical protein QFC22_006011 [Naganishia vaughanmartiniae]
MASNPGIALEALTPRIVTFTDEQVDRSCQLNGCKSLDELFKPWQSTVESGQFCQFGGGGTIPYSPDIAADIISNLIHSAIHGDGRSGLAKLSYMWRLTADYV